MSGAPLRPRQAGESLRRVVNSREVDAYLSLRARQFLRALSHYVDDDGVAWPKRTTLAADVKVAVKTIDRGIGDLREIGWLDVRPHTVPWGRGERLTSNEYVLSGHLRTLVGLPPKPVPSMASEVPSRASEVSQQTDGTPSSHGRGVPTELSHQWRAASPLSITDGTGSSRGELSHRREDNNPSKTERHSLAKTQAVAHYAADATDCDVRGSGFSGAAAAPNGDEPLNVDAAGGDGCTFTEFPLGSKERITRLIALLIETDPRSLSISPEEPRRLVHERVRAYRRLDGEEPNE